jgi:hypothetical protein
MHGVFSKIRGESRFRARIGAHSGGAAGVFWVEVVEEKPNGVVIQNLFDAGRNKFPRVTTMLEKELVRPLLRGRDVDRWVARSRHHILIPYEAENNGKAIAENTLKKCYPKAYEYFTGFKGRLIDRPHYRQHFAPSSQPFWSMYNVGNYTFAPHRVVWREQSAEFKCCVVPDSPGAPFIADAKLIVVECSSSDEAHFLAASLNSSPARFLIQSYVIEVQVSTHVLAHVHVPDYDGSPLHRDLAKISRSCHSAAAKGDLKEVAKLETECDGLAAKLWSITDDELKGIREALAETGRPRRAAREDEED